MGGREVERGGGDALIMLAVSPLRNLCAAAQVVCQNKETKVIWGKLVTWKDASFSMRLSSPILACCLLSPKVGFTALLQG